MQSMHKEVVKFWILQKIWYIEANQDVMKADISGDDVAEGKTNNLMSWVYLFMIHLINLFVYGK